MSAQGHVAIPKRDAAIHWSAAVAIVAIYLAGVTGRWWPTPDSAVYLGLGRSLAQGGGYCFNGEPSHAFPPGLPAILAFLRVLFGDGFWAPNIFIVLCGLGALAMTYLSMRLLAGRWVAGIITVATAGSFEFYQDSHRILSDIPFALTLWCTVYGILRYLKGGAAVWLAVVGLSTAAAMFLRVPGALILGPLALGVLFCRSVEGLGGSPTNSTLPHDATAISGSPSRLRRFLAAGVVGVVAIGVLCTLWLLARTVSTQVPHYVRLLETGTRAGRTPLGLFGQGLLVIPSALGEILLGQRHLEIFGVMAMALIAVGLVRLARRQGLLIPSLVILYPLGLAAGLGPFGMKARYLAPVLPALLLAMFTGLEILKDAIAKGRTIAKVPPAAILAMCFILIFNAPRLLRNATYYSAASYTPGYYKTILDGRYALDFEVAETIRKCTPSASRIGTNFDHKDILHVASGAVILDLPAAVGEKSPVFPAPVVRTEFDLVLLDITGIDDNVRGVVLGMAADYRWRPVAASDRFILWGRVFARGGASGPGWEMAYYCYPTPFP